MAIAYIGGRMADEGQPGKQGSSKWIFAAVLFAIAIFISVTIAYKIITRGP